MSTTSPAPSRPGGEATIHPSALCETVHVGRGSLIGAFTRVHEGAHIGIDCFIGDGVVIESGAVLGDRVTVESGSFLCTGVTCGDDVFVGPHVVFTNELHPRAGRHRRTVELVETPVQGGATLGAGTVVLGGVTIGHYGFTAAGPVITSDVADHALAIGSPAHQQGWVCRCGARLKGLTCPACGTVHDMQLDAPGLQVVNETNDGP